jgi:wyosine [tRNA(Phe)-imidazoG37] synthetase (radical SAM superfamily)
MLGYVASGEIFQEPCFAQLPPELRRLNDIAFSGDGEPTTFKNFDEIIRQVADLKRRHNRPEVKLVLITNASMFHRPRVRQGLELLDQNNGEIWAKLDAGTDAYYQLIERTKIPFQQVLDNIAAAAQVRPLVIQSLFMRVAGDPPGAEEIDAFIQRLQDVLAAGGRLKLVQVYTVARPPAESFVTPLTNDEVDAIAGRVTAETGLPAESFYS